MKFERRSRLKLFSSNIWKNFKNPPQVNNENSINFCDFFGYDYKPIERRLKKKDEAEFVAVGHILKTTEIAAIKIIKKTGMKSGFFKDKN